MLHIIDKEIRLHILSRRFQILAAVGAAFIWLCLLDGYAAYVDRVIDYRDGQALTRTRLEQIRATQGISSIAAEGYFVHKPPVVLSIFSRSLAPIFGRTASTGWAEMALRMKASPLAVDAPSASFLPLDLGVFIEIVLSLFVLLLTFDAFCGEKQDGTLRLTASCSVSRARLLIAKGIGAFAVVMVSFWIPFLLGFAVVQLMPDVSLTSVEMQRLLLFALVICAFLAVFTAAGILGSGLCHASSSSFILLLAYWAAAIVVLPKVGLSVADAIQPAPSVHEHRADLEAVFKESVRLRGLAWPAAEEAYRKEHGRDWGETPEGREARAIFNRGSLYKSLDYIDENNRKLNREFQNRYIARADLARAIASFSPAFALRQSLSILCGTGIERQKRFESRFDEYTKGEWEDWLDKETWDNYFSNAWPEKYGKYIWDASDLPVFSYREEWPDVELRDVLLSVGLLVGWTLLFFAAAFVCMLRYDAR